jgi:nucleoside-diphosphate-sugar epimerase
MPTALLTGANGFLGKHIYAVLKSGYDVETLGVNPNNNYIADLSSGNISLLHPVDLVVHAAAKAHSKSEKDAALFYNINAGGSKRICDAFDRLGTYPKQFVFISTVAVYGAVSGENISETFPLNGESAYAKSKIEAEKIIKTWCESHGITCTILRLPLVAGSNAPGNIAAMVKGIRNNRFFIIGKGDARKSMVLASDVSGIIPVVAGIGGVYNLTDGVNPSMAEFANVISAQLNKRPPVSLPFWVCKLLAKTGDILGKNFPFNSSVLTQLNSTLIFCDEKARKVIGWKPNPVLTNFKI